MGKIDFDESMTNYWLHPDIAEDERTKILIPGHVLTHQTEFNNEKC